MATVYTYGVGPTGYGDGTTNSGWQPQTYVYGGKLTFSEAGDVDQLGFYAQNTDAGTSLGVKVALFDTSGNRVADGGTYTMAASAAMNWYDAPAFTAVSVSATNYVILTSTQSNAIFYGYDTANAGTYATESYASFPSTAPSSFVLDGDSGVGYGRRANFTAADPVHALTATSVQSTSELSTPAVGQVHALTATSVQSTSELSTPAVGQVHGLLAGGVQSTSEISAPSLSETHALLADNVQTTSEVSSPAIGQTHALLADSVQAASEVSAPILAEAGTTDSLLAEDIESASQVSLPALSQLHILTAVSVQSASSTSNPRLDRQASYFNYVPRDVPFNTSPQMREFLETELADISYAIREINKRG